MVAGCARDVLVTGALDTYEERRLVAQQFASGSGNQCPPQTITQWYYNNRSKIPNQSKEGGVSWDCLGDFLIVTGLVRMMKCACE